MKILFIFLSLTFSSFTFSSDQFDESLFHSLIGVETEWASLTGNILRREINGIDCLQKLKTHERLVIDSYSCSIRPFSIKLEELYLATQSNFIENNQEIAEEVKQRNIKNPKIVKCKSKAKKKSCKIVLRLKMNWIQT